MGKDSAMKNIYTIHTITEGITSLIWSLKNVLCIQRTSKTYRSPNQLYPFTLTLMLHFKEQSQKFIDDSEDLLEVARSEYRIDNDDQLPTTDESLCLWLTTYEGDERDLLWWCGRLKLALELDQVENKELYMCTRYHDTCNSSGAVAMILSKEDALEWYENEKKNLVDWDPEYIKYTTYWPSNFSFDDGDWSTLIVETSPAVRTTCHNIF